MSTQVAVNGYGTIGKRVADAVALQPDMELVGVAKTRPNHEAELAVENGYPLYAAIEERAELFADAGIDLAGALSIRDDVFQPGMEAPRDLRHPGTQRGVAPMQRAREQDGRQGRDGRNQPELRGDELSQAGRCRIALPKGGAPCRLHAFAKDSRQHSPHLRLTFREMAIKSGLAHADPHGQGLGRDGVGPLLPSHPEHRVQDLPTSLFAGLTGFHIVTQSEILLTVCY
jgi:hypothetical protein